MSTLKATRIQHLIDPFFAHPLTIKLLLFRINYLLFGLRPQLFHLTNILLHAIVCILFTRISFCVAGLRRQFAFIAGTIFALHPIHSEAVSKQTERVNFQASLLKNTTPITTLFHHPQVTGIVGRADVLACLFFLLSLLLYHG